MFSYFLCTLSSVVTLLIIILTPTAYLNTVSLRSIKENNAQNSVDVWGLTPASELSTEASWIESSSLLLYN